MNSGAASSSVTACAALAARTSACRVASVRFAPSICGASCSASRRLPSRAPLAPFEVLGQRTWQPGSPAGWPDRSADWDGASALLKRLQWADAVGARLGNRRDATQLAPQMLGVNLTDATRQAVARASSAAQAVTLLLAAPEFMRR